MGKVALKMYRSCLRKCAYRTERIATNKALEIEKERGVKLYVYYCPICGHYHLTHKERIKNDDKGNH